MDVGIVPTVRNGSLMRTWKVILGVGGACATCCAVPLLGGAAALTAGSEALIASGAAIADCADEFLPLAAVSLVLFAVGGSLLWWHRRETRKAVLKSGCDGGCNSGCN